MLSCVDLGQPDRQRCLPPSPVSHPRACRWRREPGDGGGRASPTHQQVCLTRPYPSEPTPQSEGQAQIPSPRGDPASYSVALGHCGQQRTHSCSTHLHRCGLQASPALKVAAWGGGQLSPNPVPEARGVACTLLLSQLLLAHTYSHSHRHIYTHRHTYYRHIHTHRHTTDIYTDTVTHTHSGRVPSHSRSPSLSVSQIPPLRGSAPQHIKFHLCFKLCVSVCVSPRRLLCGAGN